MDFPKVLVAAPINERKSYCIEDYLQNCSELTYPNKEFYFVDNSSNPEWHIENVVSQGYACGYVQPFGRNQDFITLSQETIRHFAIKNNFDYLFFKEADVIVPSNIIEEMVSYQSPVVSANYFIGQGEKARLMMMEISDNEFGITTNRNMLTEESFLDYVWQENRSDMHGFGCLLIHRSIFTQFAFHVLPNDTSHSDITFFFDLNQAGIKTVSHPVIVKHLNSKWDSIIHT
jgi:hypothetical protein